MRGVKFLSFALIFMIAVISFESHGMANPIPDEKILTQSDVDNWVPNPLIGAHKWKKYFSDEKYSSSKIAESIWHYDSEAMIKAKTEKLKFKGQTLGLEGATLVWVKVVELKTNRARFLFYGLWPEKRVALFFGIFEREDGIRYFENIDEMADIKAMTPGLTREVLENLFNTIFKQWWKVW